MSKIGYLHSGGESPLDMQIGGSHYKKYNPQPIEMFATLNCDYFRASITKYVLRYKEKNGMQDLQKAKHIFQLADQLHVEGGCTSAELEYVNIFCQANGITSDIERIIKAAMYGDWRVGAEFVSLLIGAEYPNEE